MTYSIVSAAVVINEYVRWRSSYVFLYMQKGQKNDVISTIVKLEFGDRALGETSKIECSSDKETDIDYKTTLSIATDDPLFLDDLANKPVIC